jgi:hypothetical protein
MRNLPVKPSELRRRRRHILRKVKRGEVEYKEPWHMPCPLEGRMEEFEEKRQK